MDADPLSAVTEHDIASGRVLACLARPATERVVLRFANRSPSTDG
ncbi:hypothetical protein [Nocardia sp. NBC_00416]